MEKNFDYKQVPWMYAHCLNDECKRSAECLRFKVGSAVTEDVTRYVTVNLAYVKRQTNCEWFRPAEPKRFYFGITHLYDNLPKRTSERLWATIHDYIGHGSYYRIRSKERAIKPHEEKFIRKAFLDEGIAEEPKFDEYKDLYDFSS